MIRIRKSEARGYFDFGWLQTHHTFSFGEYFDPEHVHFRALRVINEDRVQPGQGFGMHGHRDMEIVTLVLSGAIEHQDSLGNGEILRPGELQRMTAGAGIRHSEFNPSTTDPLHLYQIWLTPERRGLTPSYEQKAFGPSERIDRWQLVASPDGQNGSITIHQDAQLLLTTLTSGQSLSHSIATGRAAWLQILTGSVAIDHELLQAGDGAAITDETTVTISASENSEVLLFDLA